MHATVKKSIPRGLAFAALASLMTILSAGNSRAQWATNGANINNTNTGNVGIGTSSPESRLHLGGSTGNTVTIDTPGAAKGRLETIPGVINWLGTTLNANYNAGWNLDTTSYDGWFLKLSTRTAPGTASDENGMWLFRVPAGSNPHRLDEYPVLGATVDKVAVGKLTISYAPTSALDVKSAGSTSSTSGLSVINSSNVTNLFVRDDGNMGIGTTSPGARLDVGVGAAARGSDSDVLVGTSGNNAQIELYGPTRSSAITHDETVGGMIFYTNGPTWTPSMLVSNTGNVGIGTTAPTSKLHVVGDITVTGNINAKYQDVAEWVPATEKLAAGTVVVVDAKSNNQVLASTSAYDTGVAGVVSAQPGLTLGEAGEGKTLVATTGRVKVRVDATHAPIRAGDLLVTSDVPGVAMKSEPVSLGGVAIHRPGTIIGKALESLDKGKGEILVLLSLQ